MKNLKTLLIIVAILGIAAYAGQNIIIETARLDGFIYGNKSGGIDSLIVPDVDSLGQYKYQNAKDPTNPLDVVNFRTLVSSSASGWDSIPFNPANGDQDAYLSGSIIYTTNFDDRYIELSDTTDLAVTITQLNDSISVLNAKIDNDLVPTTFTITLPSAGSVQSRITGATEVPDGWTLTADGLNIDIEHNLGRYCSGVTVWATTTDPANQQLTNTAAYNGLVNVDTDNTKILSLATILKEIRIFISFTQ